MTQPTDRQASVVLPCSELDATLDFFTDRLGFHVEAIFPADDPETVTLSGHGTRIQLVRGAHGDPGVVRIRGMESGTLVAPNGTRIELFEAEAPVTVPAGERSFVLSRFDEAASWVRGRAGMHYRDLIPGRQGGRLIASHIRIPDGGPVPDYVHFHEIVFQMIYCYQGWVRVVYEDQGDPFVLEAGDCVLQPPRIRHRVLESSPGLEVIEIGCPARHRTLADLELELPTRTTRPDRRFGGQRFVRHVAGEASWQPWRLEGFTCRDTGIAAATEGLADARVVRGADAVQQSWGRKGDTFLFVLSGTLGLTRPESPGTLSYELSPGDAVVLPGAEALDVAAKRVEFLEVLVNVGKPPQA